MSYTTAALPRRYLLGTSLLSQQPIELAEASGERQKHGLLLVTEFHVPACIRCACCMVPAVVNSSC